MDAGHCLTELKLGNHRRIPTGKPTSNPEGGKRNKNPTTRKNFTWVSRVSPPGPRSQMRTCRDTLRALRDSICSAKSVITLGQKCGKARQQKLTRRRHEIGTKVARGRISDSNLMKSWRRGCPRRSLTSRQTRPANQGSVENSRTPIATRLSASCC